MGSGITIVDDVILLLISKEAVAIDNKKNLLLLERGRERKREKGIAYYGGAYIVVQLQLSSHSATKSHQYIRRGHSV